MASRYGGGHEDLERERALLRSIEGGVDSLTAKEKVRAKESGLANVEAERGITQRERLTQIQREQRQVQERLAQVEGTEAPAIDRTTASIQRQTAAREALTKAQVNQQRALAGARDPLFGRATALGREGLPPSQYQLRRDLGIGSTRASRLQEAIQAGYRPAPPGGVPHGPLAPREAVVQADIDKAAASKQYAAAVRRGDQAAAEAAAAAREEAAARREAASAQLKSARSAREEAAVRDATLARTAGVPPSTALVPRTAAVTGREGPFSSPIGAGGALYGQSGYAPVGGPFAQNRRLTGVQAVERSRPESETVAQVKARAVAHQTLVQALDAEARAVHDTAYSAAAQARDRAAGAEERMARATHFSAVELGTANQVIRQHGTLTSEFITAALRGETTLREMGQQALVTAGKFGAWTGAATAIFGAVAAVHQLGQGAIDSSSGVNQLQRVVNNVNGDKLQEQFSGLAGEFNVPINIATDAVYRMGQVFHNQTDAVMAARAALYSYKTGEVDVATSTQNLIAIVNGFGLGADQLTHVFDQINQAQNKFGIGIGDTEAGLAKAGGVYRQAGGDLDYLLALFVAIQKATNRSGQEIGTGIARGVNQIRQPTNQAKLRQQGVDVDPENFQKTLQSAMERARAGADVQQLATGLLGNQYARLITPVLRDQTRLNQALKDTSPEASKGSAQRELSRVLGSVDEQIKKIGVSLQRLGAGLARAGLGDIPYVMLRGLNFVLDTAVRLVDIFDKLPAPLRHALALFGQIALVLRVIRRFGGLPGIAEKVPGAGFLAAPEQRQRSLAIRGARDAEDAANRYRERSTQSAYNAQARADVLARQAGTANAGYAAAARAGTLPKEYSNERLALERRNLILNQEAALAEEAAVKAQIEANTARELSLAASARKVELEKLSAARVNEIVLAERLAYPASFNIPEPRGAVVPGGRSATPRVASGGLAGPIDVAAVGRAAAQGAGYVVDAEKVTTEAARGMSKLEQAVLPYTAGLRRFGEQAREGGLSGRAVQKGSDLAAEGIDRGAGALRGAGGALRGLGSSIAGLARALGPLDYAILGFIAFEGISSIADKVQEDQERALKAIESVPSTQGQVQARNEAIKDALARHTPTTTEGLESIAGVGQGHVRPLLENVSKAGGFFASNVRDVATLRVFGSNYESAAQREKRLRREAELAQQEQRTISQLQSRARSRGGPVPLQTLDQVRSSVARDAKLRAQGIISLAEFDRRMQQHAVEIKTARNPTAAGLAATRAALAEANRQNAPDLFHRYQGAGVDEVRGRLALLGSQVSTGDAGPKVVREYQYAYRRLIDQTGGSRDPKVMAQFLQDREAFFKAMEDGAQALLQVTLAGAQTEGDRRRAFQQAGRTLSQIPRADATALHADQRRLGQAGIKFTQDNRRRQIVGDIDSFLGRAFGGDGAKDDPLHSKIQELQQKLAADTKADRGDIAKYQKAIRDDKKRLNDALRRRRRDQRALEEQAFQDREAGRDINLALAQSRTRDPVRQAQLAADSARRSLADARAHGSARDRHQAEAKVNQAEVQSDQALLARAQALDQVREAQVALATGNDPTAVAQAALQSARHTLSILRQQHADPGAVATALSQVYLAEAQLAQTALDESRAIAALRFQLAAARAGGGAEASARAAQQTARYDLSHAKNKKARLQALLDLATANNQAEQAAVDAEAARYELLASMTDDPVKQAQYRVQSDQNALRHAHGVGAKRRARAQLNTDRRAVLDARLTAREGDIDFDLEMERITRQQAVTQYQTLLRAHNLTKAQRREIMQKIHQLQKDGEQEASGFGLQVGQGVKVPTIYDIRRAISGARQAADQGTTYHAKTDVTVNVEVNDPDAAGAVFDAIDDALTTGVKANVRNAGMSLR